MGLHQCPTPGWGRWQAESDAAWARWEAEQAKADPPAPPVPAPKPEPAVAQQPGGARPVWERDR